MRNSTTAPSTTVGGVGIINTTEASINQDETYDASVNSRTATAASATYVSADTLSTTTQSILFENSTTIPTPSGTGGFTINPSYNEDGTFSGRIDEFDLISSSFLTPSTTDLIFIYSGTISGSPGVLTGNSYGTQLTKGGITYYRNASCTVGVRVFDTYNGALDYRSSSANLPLSGMRGYPYGPKHIRLSGFDYWESARVESSTLGKWLPVTDA